MGGLALNVGPGAEGRRSPPPGLQGQAGMGDPAAPRLQSGGRWPRRISCGGLAGGHLPRRSVPAGGRAGRWERRSLGTRPPPPTRTFSRRRGSERRAGLVSDPSAASPWGYGLRPARDPRPGGYPAVPPRHRRSEARRRHASAGDRGRGDRATCAQRQRTRIPGRPLCAPAFPGDAGRVRGAGRQGRGRPARGGTRESGRLRPRLQPCRPAEGTGPGSPRLRHGTPVSGEGGERGGGGGGTLPSGLPAAWQPQQSPRQGRGRPTLNWKRPG